MSDGVYRPLTIEMITGGREGEIADQVARYIIENGRQFPDILSTSAGDVALVSEALVELGYWREVGEVSHGLLGKINPRLFYHWTRE